MNEFYQDLSSAMPKLDHAAFRDERAGNPVVVFILLAALKAWIVYQLRKHTCSRKGEILEAIRLWIIDNIHRPPLATRLSNLAERTMRAICF